MEKAALTSTFGHPAVPVCLLGLFLMLVLMPRRVQAIMNHLFSALDAPFIMARNGARTALVFAREKYLIGLAYAGIEGNVPQRIIGSLVCSVLAVLAVTAEAEVVFKTYGSVFMTGGNGSGIFPWSPEVLMGLALLSSVLFWGILLLDLHELTHWTTYENAGGYKKKALKATALAAILITFATMIALAYWRWWSLYQADSEETQSAESFLNQVQGDNMEQILSAPPETQTEGSPTLVPLICFVTTALLVTMTGLTALPTIVPFLVLVVLSIVMAVVGGVLGMVYLSSIIVDRMIHVVYNLSASCFEFIAAPFEFLRSRVNWDQDTPDHPANTPDAIPAAPDIPNETPPEDGRRESNINSNQETEQSLTDQEIEENETHRTEHSVSDVEGNAPLPSRYGEGEWNIFDR